MLESLLLLVVVASLVVPSRVKKEHILLATAAILWVIWKPRNGACFKNSYPSDLVGLISHISNVFHSWFRLQKTILRSRQTE